MAEPMTWSTSKDENAAIEALCSAIRSMTEVLHLVEDARYLEPSGGHVIDQPIQALVAAENHREVTAGSDR